MIEQLFELLNKRMSKHLQSVPLLIHKPPGLMFQSIQVVRRGGIAKLPDRMMSVLQIDLKPGMKIIAGCKIVIPIITFPGTDYP